MNTENNVKLPMYVGSKSYCYNIISSLIESGGNPKNLISINYCSDVNYLYFINDLGNIDYCLRDRYEKILSNSFELMDEPISRIYRGGGLTAKSLIPGEIYMSAHHYGTPFIYRGVNELNDQLVDMFCFLSWGDNKLVTCPKPTGWLTLNNVATVTRAQRDLLMDALYEANVFFDKKQLKLLQVEEYTITYGRPVLLRFENNQKWEAVIVTGISQLAGFYYRGDLLPYNDDTKKLVGKFDEADKKYVCYNFK